jgi:hypothetical protein
MELTVSLNSALVVGSLAYVTPRPFYPQKIDLVPIVQQVGWAPGSVWTGAQDIASTGIRCQPRPARSESLYRIS